MAAQFPAGWLTPGAVLPQQLAQQYAGLGALGTGLANALTGYPAMTANFQTTVNVYYLLDQATDTWRMKVTLQQGPAGQMFVLYDGPFPVTKEGLFQHFAALTTEALGVEDK